MKHIIRIATGSLCCIALLMSACTPMDYYYKDLVKKADRVYTGKADSVWTMPGKERMQIAWIAPSDPVAQQIRVFWNNGLDSLTEEVGSPGDTGKLVIPNLDEIRYTFNVVTLGADGNRSLPVELTDEVYGDRFQSTLRNRVLRQASMTPDSIILSWFEEFSETMVHTDVYYQSLSGESKKIRMLPSETDTTLYDMDPNQEITFQSYFLPDSSAIDTFSTESTSANPHDFLVRNFNLTGTGTNTADFMDFALASVQNETSASAAPGNIDLAHLRGASTGHNLIPMTNIAAFRAFSSGFGDRIEAWDTLNDGLLVNLGNDAAHTTLYESLDEKDRAGMQTAYETAAGIETPANRLTLIEAGDIIFFHSVDRDIYVVMQVLRAEASGGLEIDFKVSRPTP